MKVFRQVVLAILSVALGVTFVYSAWTKLNPIESFEYTIVEFLRLPWLLAAVGARLLIGIEVGLGFLICFHLFGKKSWVLKSAIVILIVFSIYLAYLWVAAGNNVNCGCFGDAIWMSPSSSLLKNGIMIVVLFTILRYHAGARFKWAGKIPLVIMPVIVAIPFILFAIPAQQPNWLRKDAFVLDMSPLYSPEKAKPVPSIDLRSGKHIVAFLSLSCSHCRMAARKMAIMKEKNPVLPFYFLIAGKDMYLESFWEETKAENIPHTRLDADSFTGMAGYNWPVIYWLNNSSVVAQSNYVQLSQAEIEKWLSEEH